jgi:hypothetical protein
MPHLELGTIGSHFNRLVDHCLSTLKISVVVVADFGNYEGSATS